MKNLVWGKRWPLPKESDKNKVAEPPARIKQKEFWVGSAFGAAVGARSFPGIIAVHANADYILNFEKADRRADPDRESGTLFRK